MKCFKEILLLLWCITSTNTLCTNKTICISSGNEREGDCPSSEIFHGLYGLTANQIECNNVHIFLTSGIHVLDSNLEFSDSVEATEICGAPHGQPSIIECRNNSGIRFSENESANKLLISNVMFLHCQRRNATNSDVSKISIQAALYLKNAVYTLSGVTVVDTDGWGLYAENCRGQIIFNSTFARNKGNINILSYSLDMSPTVINKTNIHDSTNNSGIHINIPHAKLIWPMGISALSVVISKQTVMATCL